MLERDMTHEGCAPGASHLNHTSTLSNLTSKKCPAFDEAVRQAPESVSYPFTKGLVTAFM